MSASERLRALEVRGDLPWTTKERLDALLPLIADCIALAEDVAETDKPLWGTKDGVGFKLQNALADLTEALDANG